MFRRKRVTPAGRWLWLEKLAADVRQAVRGFAKAPGFTLTVLATLALGIGANSAIFTVVKAVLLNPLPYPDADHIVSVGGWREEGGISEPVFAFWEQNNPGFEDLAAYRAGARMNLNGGDRPELVETVTASRNYFRLFGANLILGRTFSAAEDSPGGPCALVMSYGLWRDLFGGNPSILGRSLLLGGASYTVAGVLSPSFEPYPPADVWIPLQADPNSANYAGVLTVAARLPRDVTLAQGNTRLLALRKRWARSLLFYKPRIQFSLLRQTITGNVRPALLILLGAVGLVLLIACANVANLLLARATAGDRHPCRDRRAPGAHCAAVAHREFAVGFRRSGLRPDACIVGRAGAVGLHARRPASRAGDCGHSGTRSASGRVHLGAGDSYWGALRSGAGTISRDRARRRRALRAAGASP